MAIFLTLERPEVFYLLRLVQAAYRRARAKRGASDYQPAPGRSHSEDIRMGHASELIHVLEESLNLDHDPEYAAPDAWRRSLDEGGEQT